MNEIAFYMHSGSGNHGCEAIVDSLTRLLNENEHTPVTLVSYSRTEDETYLPEDVKANLTMTEEQHIERHLLAHVYYYTLRRMTGDDESFLRYRLAPIASRNVRKAPEAMAAGQLPKVAVSIGGDNYCYDMMVKDLMRANRMLNRQGTRTILLGCSIEPEVLQHGNQALLEDMNRYERILARESLTYNALVEAGISKDKVMLVPDPAFTLPANEDALPEGFETGNTVGINLSPMALDYAADKDAVVNGYAALIQAILDHTTMNAALIPHVVWSRSDDRVPLQRLYDRFRDSGRVILVPDMSAERLKGVIANCRFFIGARTHATIAAYSTLVPTLVIGYSVKARGIARDLFGQDEHFVLPVQMLTHPEDLIREFEWLYHNEDEIRFDLTGAIPMYRKQAEQNADVVRAVLHETRQAQGSV